MTSDKQLESLRKTLRKKLLDASGEIPIAAADLRTVLDELGRLQQSNDRLRRQNRRVRLRLQRAGLDDAELGEAEPDGGDGAGDGGGPDPA